MTSDELRVGDVALDLAQGRPVHVLSNPGVTAAEWSELNDYELCENYGNARLDADPDDAVFEVVYCSSIKSEPSKTYTMPESRLARIETEAADEGPAVADRVREAFLADLLAEAHRMGNGELTTAVKAVAAAVVDDETIAAAETEADR